MIDIFEAGLDAPHLFGDVHKINGKALAFVALDEVDVFLQDACIQHDDAVAVIFGSILNQRRDGHVQKGNVTVVCRKEYRYFLIGHVSDVICHTVAPPGNCSAHYTTPSLNCQQIFGNVRYNVSQKGATHGRQQGNSQEILGKRKVE